MYTFTIVKTKYFAETWRESLPQLVDSCFGASFIYANGTHSKVNVLKFPSAHRWLIHGQENTNSFAIPEYDLDYGMTIKEIAYLFENIAHHYPWSIFKWGAFESLDMIACITTDSNFQHKLEAVFKTLALEKGINTGENSYFVSKLQIDYGICDVVTGLLYYEEQESKATGVWQISENDKEPPLLFYAPPLEAIDASEQIHRRIPNNILADMKEVATFRDFDTKNFPSLDPFVLFRIRTRDTFEEICKQRHARLISFSGDCDLNFIHDLFKAVSNFYEEEFDLLQQIAHKTKWAYGVNFGGEDTPQDVFVTHSSKLIRTHLEHLETKHKPFRLISFI